MFNPFLLLSDSSSASLDPYTISSSNAVAITDNSSSNSNIYKDLFEIVLLCTIDEQPSTSLIYLADLAEESPENWNKNTIDQALFERLHITDPSSQLLTSSLKKSTITLDTNIITENRCLYYLAGCYQRLLRQRVSFPILFVNPIFCLRQRFTYRIILN